MTTVKANASIPKSNRIRVRFVGDSGRSVYSGLLPCTWGKGCKKVLRPDTGNVGYVKGNEVSSGSLISKGGSLGERTEEVMGKIIRTTREWWLIGLCVLLFVMQIYPNLVEGVYPVIDSIGNNLMSVPVEKKIYKCGDTVKGYFLFQKHRSLVGKIEWKLVPNRPNAIAYPYKSRSVASPAGIISHWVDIEKLPANCIHGTYHFEGLVTYPLTLGSVNYPLRTVCFEIGGVQ